MNLKEIYSDMLEESWGGMSMRRPQTAPGVEAPAEVKNQYTAQQVKFGTTEMLPMTINAYEQEESSELNLGKLKNFINNLKNELDQSNISDRSGIQVIARIKKEFRL
jgi:hypothetical protein